MKTLWAPWRMEFIKKAHKKSRACVFCDLPKQGANQKNLILHLGQKSFVILNRYPYMNGHLMIIPHRHTAKLSNINAEEHAEMGQFLSQSVSALTKEFKAHGFNIGMNLGRAAGAGIKNHLHYHVVPRWVGDTNFMPLFAETRVVPEHLEETYQRLKKYFA